MTYKFLDAIKDIEADLRANADQANEEKQRINTRQAEIDADLSELEPRLLRTQRLKSRDELICADCFIIHNIESPLTPMSGGSHVDRFRCRKCNAEYEENF